MTTRIFALSLVWCLTGFAADVSARPRYRFNPNPPMRVQYHSVPLVDVLQSPTIVIAKFDGPPNLDAYEVKFEVVKTIRGDLKPGKHVVKVEDFVDYDPKMREFVAFLDENLQWRCVATAIDWKGPGVIDDRPLCVKSLREHTSVSTSAITLGQLETFAAERKLAYRFRGALHFPQAAKTEWKASALTISGTYDPATKKVDAKLPVEFQGAGETIASVHADGVARCAVVDLDFSGQRKLRTIGYVDKVDPATGEYLAQFTVWVPELFTEQSFKDYTSDRKTIGAVATFKLPCEPVQKARAKRELTLVIGPRRFDAKLIGWDNEPIVIQDIAHGDGDFLYGNVDQLRKTGVFDRLLTTSDDVLRLAGMSASGDTLLLELRLDGNLRPEWPSRANNLLLHLLYSSPVRGTLLTSDGTNETRIATFTPRYESFKLSSDPQGLSGSAE